MDTDRKPEPDEFVAEIRKALKWGPVNAQVAVAAGFCCEYCGTDMLKSLEAYYSWQIDQIIPAGGYTPENCALACRTCNHLKHARIPMGAGRKEQIADAWAHIQQKMAARQIELDQLRQLVSYTGGLAGA